MPSSQYSKNNDLIKRASLFFVVIIFFFLIINPFLLYASTTQDTIAVTEVVVADDGIPTDQVIIEAGQTLFKNNCAVCHLIQGVVIGPPLANVYERRNVEWITLFVRNSQQVIQSGDEYAINLYNEYNKTEMTAFDFSDEEIISVLAYIKYETENPPQPVVEISTAGTDTTTDTSASLISERYMVAIFIGLIIIMALILVVLVLLLTTITQYLRQKEDLSQAEQEVLSQRFNLKDFVRSPAFVGAVTLIFLTIFAKMVIDSLFLIGVQQNYSPTQPIAYSHKVHAGDFAIECQYCHTGVAESKNANIPSANICMNCHTGIIKITDSEEISEEIMKIHDAVESGTPIEWVRVHNLSDLAYFSHAQHYNVGGVECETCHGLIEEMEVVTQYANLTMGWCIDCHRTTEIKADNAYYDKLVAIHEESSSKPMMVEDIGGLECSKCHY